jgi:signal transduction histidine kinase
MSLFQRARRRLTATYIALFALVLAVFSIAFFAVLALVLQPAFDIAPEISDSEAAEIAYRGTLERVGVALVTADIAVLLLVGGLAWVLAARTMRPIQEASERQRRFVSDASHELRNPLAAIRATSEAALSPQAGPDDRVSALHVVLAESERLSTLSADLLTLARGDEPLARDRVEPIDLSVVIAEALEPRLADPSLRGRLDQDLAPDVLVRIDPIDLRRLLDNLVDNAFRYGGPATRVRVRTWADEREAILDVTDDGPGIPAVDLARIFEPFTRIRPDADAPEGTGLGLAIVRGLARRNGGDVRLESRPGSGSRFEVTLPRVP